MNSNDDLQTREGTSESKRRLNPKAPKMMADLTDDQMRVYEEMVDIINSSNVDSLYDQISDAHGGKVISTDAARELSPSYRTREGALLYSAVTAPPASTYAQDRYLSEIAKTTRQRKKLLVTAGGPASGKTRSLSSSLLDSVDLVFDQNLGKYKRSVQQLEAALSHGWTILVFHVYRPFPLAIERVIQRSDTKGRWAPLDRIPDAHVRAQESVVKLYDKYSNSSSVSFRLVANLWTLENPIEPIDISIHDIRQGGKYHLGDNEQLQHEVKNALVKAKPTLEPRLYEALAHGTNPAAWVG